MIVAIAQQKGGVGKSTLAICLAAEAHTSGLQTLLIDADEQASCRGWAVLAAEGGHLAPSVVTGGADLHTTLPALASVYDLILIDLPGRSDAVVRSALMVASMVLLPCGPDPLDYWALGGTLHLLEAARALRPQLPAFAVITRARPGTLLARQSREMLEQDGLPVLRAELRLRVAYPEAIGSGQAPSAYAPTSDAADEVRHLLSEVLKLGGLSHGKTKVRSSSSPPR